MNSSVVIETRNVQTRTTPTVHIATRYNGGRWIPLCGSGQTTTFTRKQSQYQVTTFGITCKKCAVQLAQGVYSDNVNWWAE